MDVILREAIEAIKAHPYNFLYTPEVQRAFRMLDQGIKSRTKDTDTLVVSLPADKVTSPIRLDRLLLPVTEGEDSQGVKFINFDWFTLPEKRTGFADVASGFVTELIRTLNELPDMRIPSQNEVNALKGKFVPGMKIRVTKMADDYGLSEGVISTVDFVDDFGQIHVKESGVAIIPGIDEFEVVE